MRWFSRTGPVADPVQGQAQSTDPLVKRDVAKIENAKDFWKEVFTDSIRWMISDETQPSQCAKIVNIAGEIADEALSAIESRWPTGEPE